MERSSDELKCGPEELCFSGEVGAPGRAATSLGHLKARVDLRVQFWGRLSRGSRKQRSSSPGSERNQEEELPKGPEFREDTLIL